MTITEDLILGARFTLDLSGGVLTRVFEVNGLAPGRDTLAQAAGAQDEATGVRIPAYGDGHPGVPGLYVAAVEAEPVEHARTAARVTVRYESPELSSAPNVVKIAIGGSNRAKLAWRSAADGSPFQVKYTDAAGNVLQEFLQVPVLSPNTILTFTRQEFKSPLKVSARLRRTVNAGPWQAGESRQWLCRAIDAVSLGNLSRYEVKYVFEYDPDGWDRIEYYRDPYTGRVPADAELSAGNDRGVARLQPYATADFNELKLPNAF